MALELLSPPVIDRPPVPVGASVEARLKRVIDVVAAVAILLALLPLLVLIAVLILAESPGPLFYRAERVGRGGRRLRMLKFRKMAPDAAGGPLTLDGDRRLTRVGALLHRTRLDELPQLWHVLRGEMSLVGPRPEAPEFVALHAAAYADILSVRPGVTGWTQLAFADECRLLRAEDPRRLYVELLLPQKVALDRLYATSPHQLRNDARILARTVAALVLRRPVAVNRRTGKLTTRRRGECGGAARRFFPSPRSSGLRRSPVRRTDRARAGGPPSRRPMRGRNARRRPRS